MYVKRPGQGVDDLICANVPIHEDLIAMLGLDWLHWLNSVETPAIGIVRQTIWPNSCEERSAQLHWKADVTSRWSINCGKS